MSWSVDYWSLELRRWLWHTVDIRSCVHHRNIHKLVWLLAVFKTVFCEAGILSIHRHNVNDIFTHQRSVNISQHKKKMQFHIFFWIFFVRFYSLDLAGYCPYVWCFRLYLLKIRMLWQISTFVQLQNLFLEFGFTHVSRHIVKCRAWNAGLVDSNLWNKRATCGTRILTHLREISFYIGIFFIATQWPYMSYYIRCPLRKLRSIIQ